MERIELRRLDVHELQGLLDLRHAPNAFPSDLAETLLRYAGGRSWGLADAVWRLEIEGALAEDERGIWQVDDVQVAKLLGRGLYNPVSHIASRHPDYARAFEDFLLDAALCGDLVPVNLLLDLQAPDVDVKDALADLVEEELVTGLEIFADLQYGHPGFPASVNVYRFREPIIRLAILERFSRKERLAGAARVAPSLRRGLPVRTRDVAWLFVTLSEHLGEAERDEMLRDLAWWVGTEEADYLREGLVEALAEGKLKPEALWGAVEGTEGRWPPYRRLALLDAYGTGLRDEEDKPLGVPMERLGRFHRLRANPA